MGYFVLLILFLALFLLIFSPGISEWLRPRDNAPLPVDVEYVRTENYFGVSFRSRVQEWLKTAQPSSADLPDGAVRALDTTDGERILVVADGCYNPSHECDDLIYCENDLILADGSAFRKEVYGLKKVQVGARVQLRALAADGEIILGSGSEVKRWVDARRKILLCRGAIVHSRVSSMECVELAEGVSVGSVYVPLVFSSGFDCSSRLANSPENPMPAESLDDETLECPAYLDRRKSSRLDASSWLTRGDLTLPAGTCVGSNLIVQGPLRTFGNCCFHGDVKAAAIELGSENTIRGNLISEGGAEIGRSSWIAGNVAADESVSLREKVRIGRGGQLVVVSAGRDVKIGAGVMVFGKIVAGRAVVTL